MPLNHIIEPNHTLLQPPAVMSTQRRPYPRWGNETKGQTFLSLKKRHEETLFLTKYHNLTQDVWSHTFITNTSAHRRKQKPTAHTVFHFTHSVTLCSTSPSPHCYAAAAILIFLSFCVILWLKLSCHLSYDKQTKYSDGTFHESSFYM